MADQVSFLINGTQYTENSNNKLSPESRLVDYIRDEAGLKGTKWTCREGGCGACVVTVRTKDPQNGEVVVRAVNSCLTPVLSCDGWDISTVEDIGNRRDGFHPIQTRLAQLGGSQCGFCSPGMVMNMYSLANSKTELTSQDVEDNFDGNICRCTGYRPILDAFKSFTVDADSDIRKKCQDIEDMCNDCPARSLKLNGHSNGNGKISNRKSNGHGVMKNGNSPSCCCCTGGFPAKETLAPNSQNNLDITLSGGQKWNKVTNLDALFKVLTSHAQQNVKYRVVAGNTGTGVFKYDGPYDAFVEINNIPELVATSVNSSEAILGGAVTLTTAIQFLQNLSATPGFEYATAMSEHIKRVANAPVRNFGTIAGNLMMKHAHNDFPSDIFILLETIGAKVYIATTPTHMTPFSPADFLKVDMKGKLILKISLPIRQGYIFKSFKITKRHQNAHAYVNAGFLFKVDPAQRFKVLEIPTIAFGGIHPNFVRAWKTEAALNGAELGDVNTLKTALKILEQEIHPDHHLPDASPQYRKSLTQNLLYKVILGIVGKGVKEALRSGAEDLPRKQQSGKQVYDTDEEFKNSPLYKPVLKVEALVQCSGEAEYVNDIPKQQGELYGVFVLTTVAKAVLNNVDASEALKMPGVVKFLTAKDIPGKNSFYEGYLNPGVEEVFVESKVRASGQAVGLVVAESQEIANAAAKLVKIEYRNLQKPLITLKEGFHKSKNENSVDSLLYPMVVKTGDGSSKSSKHVLKGEFQTGGQAHFHMENHITIAIPKEDGLTVYCAVQGTDHAQAMIAQALNIPNNTIDIQVRRLGGGYGAKFSRATHVSVAAAIASFVCRKPVRIGLELEAGMEMMGKRLPYLFDYEVGFSDDGKIDALQVNAICDPGMSEGDASAIFACLSLQSYYSAINWSVRPGRIVTDTHTNTFCRAPGSTEGIAAIENIMEHIAHSLNKDPLEVRRVNYLQTGEEIMGMHPGKKFEGVNLVPSIIEEMKKISDYDSRKRAVEDFNKANRWRKRGMSMICMRYHQEYHGMKTSSFVAIHNQDGTVSVSHGGIEMGQGINTKVAQVVGHELGVPLSKVAVKPTNNLVAANVDCTGAGITSELVSYATLKACEELRERMAPMKKGNPEMSWEELVKKCHQGGIDLRATYMESQKDGLKPYDIYGCNLTEVEVDILTGEFKIVRLDLIEDAGKSLSPEIDMGQIEGSLVMGLGLWTEEKLVFASDTGRLLTRNTWEYKVPFPKCIPEDMRITIMRNATNPFGVLRSKATGEPPLCLAVAVLFAIKNAIKAARKDAGVTDWFQLDGPVTPEDVVRLSFTDPHSQFVY